MATTSELLFDEIRRNACHARCSLTSKGFVYKLCIMLFVEFIECGLFLLGVRMFGPLVRLISAVSVYREVTETLDLKAELFLPIRRKFLTLHIIFYVN